MGRGLGTLKVTKNIVNSKNLQKGNEFLSLYLYINKNP